MRHKIIVIALLLFFPLYIYAGNSSKAKAFGIAGFAFSLIAIGADIWAEHNYDKYNEATLPDDCTNYRDLTVISEKTRDVSFVLAVISFSVSTVYLLKGKKTDVGFKIDFREGKLCAGLRKSF